MLDLSIGKKLLILFFASLLCCSFGFYNGFPLHFFDTYSYIEAGFEGIALGSRPVGYGHFIRHTSLNESLWLVIVSQGFLLSLSIYYSFKYTFQKNIEVWQFLTYILIAMSTTAASLHASMLMPDIFTPIIMLNLITLVVGQKISIRDWIVIGLMVVLSVMIHNSHFFISTLALFGFSALAVFPTVRGWYRQLNISFKQIGVAFLLVVAGNLASAGLNYSIEGEFKASKGGSIFLFGRLTELKIAQEYLDSNCADNNYSICEYKDDMVIGNAFLWDYNKSPLYKQGGWTKENEAEYGRLVKDILTTPKHFKTYFIRNLEGSVIQSTKFHFDIGTTRTDVSYLNGLIQKWFPTHDKAYWSARQVNRGFDHDFNRLPNLIQSTTIGFCLIIIFVILFHQKHQNFRLTAIVLLLLGILYINAFVSSSGSTPIERYQSRVMWLVTLPAFVFLMDYFKKEEDEVS